MKLKKLLAFVTASAMTVALLTACNSSSNSDVASSASTASSASSSDKVTLQLGFENSLSEPVGQAAQKWADLLAEKSGGTMEIVLYPDSQLGNKSDLIDSMLLGENVATLADGAFYADYGVPDFGIVFGPFLFDNWDQCWTLIESDWYKDQCAKLEDKGLKILASNWAYGARHILTVKPVNTVDDLAGMKIRVPNNKIQSLGFDVLGATSTGMALGDVYQALQTKTIEGVENPLSTLYGRKLHEVAKYLILDGHVLNFTTWVCSNDWFNSLTEEQQEWLIETGKEAGVYNNEVQEASEQEYLQKMKDEGVTVVEPTQEVLDGFRAKAKAFYEQGEQQFGWSPDLYETVRAAMGAE
jgi:TRAP-type transport system periplasmic protein